MYTLGIDIGSTTSKCVILQDGEKLIAKSLQLGGLGRKVRRTLLRSSGAAAVCAARTWPV